MRTFPAFHHLQLRPSPLLRALGSWDFAVFLIDCLCNYKFRCKFSALGKMAWWGSPNLPPPLLFVFIFQRTICQESQSQRLSEAQDREFAQCRTLQMRKWRSREAEA